MAPRSPVASSVSDSEKPKKRSSPSKKKKEESEVEDSEPQSGAEDGEDDEEGEYEIEAILDAKKGHFPKNKLGYFVKWKGYDSEHNSWVAEDDAGNAEELIKAFWADREKKTSAKKAAEAASKRSRKSMGDEASDANGSASVAKKRGRKSVSEKPADKDDKDNDERPAKKPRKTNEKKTVKSGARNSASEEPLPEEEEIGSMAQHMHAPTWDQLIKRIDTVERVDDTLYVYFTLHGGERIREDSKVCADKFPKMLINFYESNLRWKEADHQ